MIREEALKEVHSALYAYRRLFNLPPNDPSLATISELEILLELKTDEMWQRAKKGKPLVSLADDDTFESDPEVAGLIDLLETDDEEDPWAALGWDEEDNNGNPLNTQTPQTSEDEWEEVSPEQVEEAARDG